MEEKDTIPTAETPEMEPDKGAHTEQVRAPEKMEITTPEGKSVSNIVDHELRMEGLDPDEMPDEHLREFERAAAIDSKVFDDRKDAVSVNRTAGYAAIRDAMHRTTDELAEEAGAGERNSTPSTLVNEVKHVAKHAHAPLQAL